MALIHAFEREIVQLYGLEKRQATYADDAREVTYGFRERLSADAMHDICRVIFRFLRKRKELQGIGISDRTWYTPKFDPYADTIDPIADAMTETV